MESSSSLQGFKRGVDVALGDMVCAHDLRGLFQPTRICGSVIIFPEGCGLRRDRETGKLERDCLEILRSDPVKSTGNSLKNPKKYIRLYLQYSIITI